MIFLLLSILCNVVLFIILKYFKSHNISTASAIVINYFAAAGAGMTFHFADTGRIELPQLPWFYVSFLLGFLFISVFIALAKTAQNISITAATIANKMSVIIPIIAAYFLYGDGFGILKTIGILLTLVAIFLTSESKNNSRNSILLPALVFIGSGVIDAIINYTQQKMLNESNGGLFTTYSFLCAGLTGIVFLFYLKYKSELVIGIKEIIGGVALGIPNYFTIHFILLALNRSDYDSSSLYSINNAGIVGTGALAAYVIFNEKLSKKALFGLLIAGIAIVLISIK